MDHVADVNRAIALLDAPARDGIQRRRAQGLSGAEAEAGVMPRAANGLVDEQALGEGSAVVGAERPDCEQVVAAPHQDDRLAMGMAE
jgi:hypothetical protein